MKKINLLITSLFILTASINSMQAQDNEKPVETKKNEKESENCVTKGKFIIDAYYGFPYVAGSYVKSVFTSNNGTNNNNSVESVTNWNHIGGKFEYMVTDGIGIGLEYSYAAVDVKYTEDKFANQSTIQTYHYTATLYKQRILARVNFHFGTSKKIDPYATVGVGYKVSLLKSNNPDDQKSIADFNNNFSNLVPISYRLGIGMRYFFSENIGISAEVGIGGAIVQGGICGKF